MINFKKSIYHYNPIYYHFLDGYINPNKGSNLNNFISEFHNDLILNNSDIKLYDSINNNIINSETIQENIENNKNIYQIIKVNNDLYATSLLLFIKNDKYYILCYNSGKGIMKNKEIYNTWDKFINDPSNNEYL